MRKSKTVTASLCESRKIAMPDEINPHGTLFGGVIMSWIDKVAYMCAQNFAESKKTVTVNIDNIKFLKPIYCGDHVALSAFVASVGFSSMEIEVTLHREDPVTKEREFAGEAFLTFVSLGADGKAKVVPELTLETQEDIIKHKKSQIRLAHRVELKRKLESDEVIEEKKTLCTAAGSESQKKFKPYFLENIKELTQSKLLNLVPSVNLVSWKFFRVKS